MVVFDDFRALGPAMMVAGAALLAVALVDWTGPPPPAEAPVARVAADPAPAAVPRPPAPPAAPATGQAHVIAKARAEGRPAAVTPAAAPEDGGGPVPLLATVTPAAPVLEPDAAEAVVTIQLSEPAGKPLALIYATVDGTAKAGEDYEPLRGSLTIQPGSHSAVLRVRLAAGERPPAPGQFDLVLAADPSVLALPVRKLTVTIRTD